MPEANRPSDIQREGQSRWIAFLDECGDHSLTKIDRDFPIFLLSLVLLRRDDYCETILPSINRLKLRYWDHEGANLRSRDIRKAQGPFTLLQNPERRRLFLQGITELMTSMPYELFVVGIHKERLRQRYVRADNPYDLALKFIMERVLHCLEQRRQDTLPLIAEARGRNEDNQLKATFYDLTTRGTDYVGAERIQKRRFLLEFQDKRKNVAGIQLADLCAHPSARHILKPGQPNHAFEVIRRHIYHGPGNVSGWKVFP
jgi:hypothetical protein